MSCSCSKSISWLHFRIKKEERAPVAKPAPYGTSKTVGAVPQPKEDANVERSEVEITENLNDKSCHENTCARNEGDFDK